MIRLGKLTDYGVGLMTRLADYGSPKLLTARDLSISLGLPLPTVSKILKLLCRAELLVSQRGPAGGYALARDPRAITLAQIVAALEGPLALTECADQKECACEFQVACRMQERWTGINRQLVAALDGITLQQMASPEFAGGMETR